LPRTSAVFGELCVANENAFGAAAECYRLAACAPRNSHSRRALFD